MRICSLQVRQGLTRCGELRTHFLQSGRECFDRFLLLCNPSLKVRAFVLFLDERRVLF